MKRLALLFIIGHLSMSVAVAQKRITREYQNQSISDALRQLAVEQSDYTIYFLYNELEDFRITTSVHRKTVPDAIRQMIGFYPIRVSTTDDDDGRKIFVECIQKADTRYKGTIIDETGQPIAYANVALLNPVDSTLLNGGVSNESGYFAIPAPSNLSPNGAAEPLLLKISFVGYKTVYQRCENPEIGTIQMQPAQYTIKGVTVDGTRIMNYVDKSVHTFSAEQIKKARHVCDLLEFVEELKIDPVSNKIKQINGGDVKILLNGVTASDIDLKGIPANKILKVEYYNIPPARYADAGVVVNVITKEAETGYSVGVEGRTAFTTGFTDDEVYYNFTSGNHQLGLSYTFSLREYTKRFSERTYDYLLNGRQTQYKNKQLDKFGYTWSDPVVKYTYNKPDDITVQVVATPHFDTYHADGESDISIHSAVDDIKGEGRFDTRDRTFGPDANVYIQKTLPKNQELAIDLVGTYYHASKEYANLQTDLNNHEKLLSDTVKQKNDKYSFIGELAYTKKWEKSSLSLGYRGTFGRSTATISNVLSNYQDYDYSSASYKNYMYVEYSGMLKRWMYRIGVGATQVTQKNDDTSDSRWLFTPKLILSTNLSKTMNLQWVTSSWATTPAISQLSNNASLVIPGVMSVGNPYLKSYNSYKTELIYKWNLSWLNTQFSVNYTYRDSPVSRYYTEQVMNGQPYIVGMSENAHFSSDFGGNIRLTVKPFKNNVLTLYFINQILYQTVSSPIIGKYHHTWAPIYYGVQFHKGNWSASYQGSVVSKQLSGSYLDAGENQSHLQVYWQKKNWRLYTACYWLLTRSRYSSNTLPTSILQSSSKTWIDDNKSMFLIGFSYNFFSGKDLDINRKLQNKDSDKGTF